MDYASSVSAAEKVSSSFKASKAGYATERVEISLDPGIAIRGSALDVEGEYRRKDLLKRQWNSRPNINQFTDTVLTNILGNAGFESTSRVSYQESMSLLTLPTPTLKYLNSYRPSRNLLSLKCRLGKITNRYEYNRVNISFGTG